jgi:UDP-N-acetylmuramoylalanine--D-glutamate ligase
LSPPSTLVVGLGVTGETVALRQRASGPVTVVEDRPTPATAARAARLAEAGVTVVEAPDPGRLAGLVAAAGLVVPSPGVPESHPVYELAARYGVPLLSEIELAATEAAALGRILVAVTGTNGKTTVTTLIAEMITAAGRRALAAGNIGRPLIDAVADDVDVVVAEVSSFQLRFTETFRPRVAVLLNVAEDHLDWHPDFDAYVAAKARIFANQRDDDLLVYNADDGAVAAVAAKAPARTVGFSLRTGAEEGYRLDGDRLVAADGTTLITRPELGRQGPHDVANALAAAAAVGDLAGLLGTDPRVGITSMLSGFAGLPHRVTPVGQSGGVRYVDDSKATNPHAALAALSGFDSVVLVAGGRNKGLDLGVLRSEAGRIRAVVAIGEAAGEVAAAFEGLRPVRRAGSMAEAVRAADELAEPGDVVLLSPACASFDWYSGYAARGDDFAACVSALIAERGERG